MVRSSLPVLVLSFVVAVPAVRAQDAGSPLIGRVIAAEHGAPLPRVRIAAVVDDHPVDPILTDDYGWFAIDARSGARISLVASKAGYAATRRLVTPAERSRIAPLELRLGRAGAITGRVVDTAGLPAVGTEVAAERIDVAGDTGPSRFSTAADDRGEYRVGGLPPGRYRIAVARQGAGTATSESSIETDVQPGAEVGRVDVVRAAGPALPPAAPTQAGPSRMRAIPGDGPREDSPDAIVEPRSGFGRGGLRGTVVDEYGDPFEGVHVEAFRLDVNDGRIEVSSYGNAVPTDDRGQYRIGGLVPGLYIVKVSTDATMSGGVRRGEQGFAPIYYPGLASVDWAYPVAVREGREQASIDVVFSPSLAVRVSGRAQDAEGQALAGTIRMVTTSREWGMALDPPPVPVRADGTFVLANVPPGDYVVQASGAPRPGRAATFGVGYVSVFDGDPPPLTVSGSPGTTLEGRVLVEGQPDAVLRSASGSTSGTVSLLAVPVDPDQAPNAGRGQNLVLSSTGAFWVTGLHGPVRLALSDDFAGWYLKAVRIGGSDVTRRSFEAGAGVATVTGAEIVIGRASSVVEGRMTDARIGPQAAPFVLLFSSESVTAPGRGIATLATPAPDGSFRVSRVPPGDYVMTAITEAEASGNWRSPEALDQFARRGVRVVVGEDERLTQDLRLGAR